MFRFNKSSTEVKLYLHDSRTENKEIKNRSVDMIFTSPPYLNNLDYGEALKVFLYFWKIAENWSGISQKIRKQAIVSSTTYYSERNFVLKSPEAILGNDFINKMPTIAEELINKIGQISAEKHKRKSKKSFDILTTLYFKDMSSVIEEMHRVLKKNTLAFIVIGDSAPYGVHIPTDTLLGEMAVELGFSSYTLRPLRVRGVKWVTLRYRHNKKLRESLLILRR
jgi:DNA modification methylase